MFISLCNSQQIILLTDGMPVIFLVFIFDCTEFFWGFQSNDVIVTFRGKFSYVEDIIR